MPRNRIKTNEKLNINDDYEVNSEGLKNLVELRNLKKVFILKNIYKIFIQTLMFLLKTLLFLFKISGIYLLWICLHYFSSHLYIKFCVPNTIFGFFMSPFMISTPHCQGLRWIVYNAAGVINNMWILIGTWLYSMIWIFNNDNNIESNSL
jgi:hypothetical protein